MRQTWKTQLIYFGGADSPVEPCHKFSTLRWLTLLIRSLNVTLRNLLFGIYFVSSEPGICSTIAFPPLGNSDYVVVLVSNDFP